MLAQIQPMGFSFSVPAVQKKKGGGFLGGLGKLISSVAPLAAAIPGVGTAAALAMSAGGKALGGIMQGEGVGSAILSGAAGAAVDPITKALLMPDISEDVAEMADETKRVGKGVGKDVAGMAAQAGIDPVIANAMGIDFDMFKDYLAGMKGGVTIGGK